jgi:GTP cyclohydrolase I
MAAAISDFLKAAGFDPAAHPHLQRSGERVAQAWADDLLEGYGLEPSLMLGDPFPADSQDLVLISDIEFFSACPHHLMPYRGKAHIAYVPDELAVGFSGVVRLLDAVAHKLTLQEWITRDIVSTLMRELEPKGAACIIEATPMCVFARGVRRPCRIASTAFGGIFEKDASLREELVSSCLRRS